VSGLTEGPVADKGSATISPVASTSVELHVTRFLGSPTSSIQQIRVQQAPQTPEPLAVSLADPSAGCDQGKVHAIVHVQRFSPDVRVATVSTRAEDARTYTVTHAGVVAAVHPGDGPAIAWSGTPILGDWVLESPLLPGESCGTPGAAALPRNLGIQAFTQCLLESHP
jgi:hypothetical protein